MQALLAVRKSTRLHVAAFNLPHEQFRAAGVLGSDSQPIGMPI
jgi:hypothetical protein